MGLYAIGDLHLSLGTNKPMDIFGGNWENYIEKIKSGLDILKPDDVCVLCGDTSWGMSLEDSLEDFKLLNSYPGKKILLKGNHDYWWNTVAKMKAFFSGNGLNNIDILHNNSFTYEDIAICGTRGWILDDETSIKHNAKITTREVIRLRASLGSASDKMEKLCFMHYPPRYKNNINNDFIDVMKEFNVKHCYYGHIHGDGFLHAVTGIADGINYDMISADYIGFMPKKLLH